MNFRELLMQETLPKKNLFTSSEVSALLKVKPHDIRHWECEFPQIRSQKNKQGQRLYRKEDVILFLAIKHLLHEKKFTIAGALKVLADSDLLENRLALAPLSSPITLADSLPIPTDEQNPNDKPCTNNHEDLLQASSHMLPELDCAFDEQTHEIYQHCASDLAEASLEVEAQHVGEMIADALTEHAHQENKISRLSKLEYEKTLATLIASKTQLDNLLKSLEKFSPNDFWGDFRNL